MEYHDHAAPFREAAPQAEGACEHKCGFSNMAHRTCKCVKCGKEKPRLVLWKDADNVGAAPAETARPFREQLEKDWMAQQKWLDFTNYLVHRLEDIETRETAGEMTAEQFAMREFGWRTDDPKFLASANTITMGTALKMANRFAKQRVEQAVDAAELRCEKLYNHEQECRIKALRAKVADLERERDEANRKVEQLCGDVKAVQKDYSEAAVELREMREALRDVTRTARVRSDALGQKCLVAHCKCSICTAERLLARKAGS